MAERSRSSSRDATSLRSRRRRRARRSAVIGDACSTDSAGAPHRMRASARSSRGRPSTLAPQDTDASRERGARSRGPGLSRLLDERAPCIYVRPRRCASGRVGMLAIARAAVARARAGYRNVLCDDAYVVIGLTRRAASRRAAALCADRADGAHANRDRGRERPGPAILHVLHSRGGGTEKYVRAIVGASRARVPPLLPSRRARSLALQGRARRARTPQAAWPRDAASRHCLRIMCAWLRIDVGSRAQPRGQRRRLPRHARRDRAAVLLLRARHVAAVPDRLPHRRAAQYCNATTDPAIVRGNASRRFGGLRDVDIVQWRERYARLLGEAPRVHAPSQWAGETLRKYYPAMRHRRHAAPAASPRSERLRDDVDVFALPRDECRHIGRPRRDRAGEGRAQDRAARRRRSASAACRFASSSSATRTGRCECSPTTACSPFTGRYRPDEVDDAARPLCVSTGRVPDHLAGDVQLHAREAWLAGRPALVPPRGALMERVQATGAGWIMSGGPTSTRWPIAWSSSRPPGTPPSSGEVGVLEGRLRCRGARGRDRLRAVSRPARGIAAHRAARGFHATRSMTPRAARWASRRCPAQCPRAVASPARDPVAPHCAAPARIGYAMGMFARWTRGAGEVERVPAFSLRELSRANPRLAAQFLWD